MIDEKYKIKRKNVNGVIVSNSGALEIAKKALAKSENETLLILTALNGADTFIKENDEVRRFLENDSI